MGFSQGVFMIVEIGQLAYSDKRFDSQLRFLIYFSSNEIKPKKMHNDNKHVITISSLKLQVLKILFIQNRSEKQQN
ncbi:unnamed protein product [Paramecium sonneborni]|uniref:Uncharacterized protein n=1 Tax=Paramecium sonneborni TaxID=65129 RepID=A0A8S1M053_9CILI|nr:unnamed protein product [Paramecium sonneborni]